MTLSKKITQKHEPKTKLVYEKKYCRRAIPTRTKQSGRSQKENRSNAVGERNVGDRSTLREYSHEDNISDQEEGELLEARTRRAT